jgi:regulatory protein NPR1
MVPIIHVASTCQIQDLLDQCIQRVAASSTFNSLYLKKELPGDTYADIMEIRRNTFPDESEYLTLDHQQQKSIRNIHMALDSDDVDLVGLLLKESTVTLDDAFAIHYAATRCTPKVVSELLKLDSANVNLKNNCGYTPLHMACIRLEPGIILSLIEKGASVLEWTPDGRDALTICKRLTREKDVNRNLEKGQKRSNAYLCIDILEQTKRTYTSNLVTVEEKVVTPLLVDDFHMKLIYLENRGLLTLLSK